METNNYVESWHNQLKATYLRRKQNRLIFILVKDIEYDYQNNVKRLMLNVVQPFSNSDISYQVEVVNHQMAECSCKDFKYNRIACKHIYLLHRFKNTIQLYQELISAEVNEETGISEEQEASTSIDRQEVDNLTNKMANLLAVYRAYKDELQLLCDDELAQVE
ncbi:uncharacterized protein BX663DRAFT_542923 [Cokeromyces recurvatus]|uniref:uncharacterized protein n=1 Tax=Cokeromyces recurvatus TaxID=90255 RepID=UPI00221FD7C8|nr:uncharacterized protein BX663DRAFT_542923 [Cokeromyces recurvatus]KAI7902884.1 hypothetical protein BX663DRAFT_542923 [Cokeromyces recurvatus]